MAEPTTSSAPSTPTYAPGAFVWHEYTTHDLATAKRFYGGLFGWTFDDMPMGDGAPYTIVMAGKQQVGGLFQYPPGNPAPDMWNGYVSVTDVDAAVKAIQQGGGQVLVPAFDVPNVGRIAVAKDPQEAIFGLMRSVHGDPDQDRRPEPGEFCWDQLVTPDFKAEAAFYGAVIGWKGEEAHGSPVFRGDGGIEASASAPEDGMRPQWIGHVVVVDMAKAQAKAKELGGTVVTTDDAGEWGQYAIIRDPLGAHVCLFAPKMG